MSEASAPDAVAVERVPLHVLVRDHPQTLAVLRAAGVTAEQLGAALNDLSDVDTAAVADALRRGITVLVGE